MDRPRNYTFDPPPGVPRSNSTHEAHIVPIHDARVVAPDISLDREGFDVLRHASAVRDFWDEDEVRRVYYPEVQRVLAEVTGAQGMRWCSRSGSGPGVIGTALKRGIAADADVEAAIASMLTLNRRHARRCCGTTFTAVRT